MTVLAHPGQPVAPHDLPMAWSLEPLTLVLLVLGGWWYVRGAGRLRATAAGRRALPRWRVGCFGGAVAAAAVAILSPLDGAAGALFSAHMAQHLLLTLVVAPLLVASRPLLVTSMAFSRDVRRALGRPRALVMPTSRGAVWLAAGAVLAHTASLWLWHVPALYELALRNEPLHVLEHVTLVAGACPFWWLVLDARGRHANAGGVLAVFAGMLQASALAGLLTFTGEAWYPAHAPGALLWGLSGLDDQHIAGGLMWFPGGLAYVIGGAVVFLRWLREDERMADRQVLARGSAR